MSRSRSELGFRRFTAGLFDQQMWCFGRDILRDSGNVLLDLGMCQYRSPHPDRGSSLYTAATADDESVFLWGFGAMYAKTGMGSVFVRRYDFTPKLSPRESAMGVHDPSQLGRLLSPVSERDFTRVRTLLVPLVRWFAKYEHWVAETLGSEYRERIVSARQKKAALPARDMASAWERTAKQCLRFKRESSPLDGPWEQLISRFRPGPVSVPAYRPPHHVFAKGVSR